MGNVTVLDPTAGPASDKGEFAPRLRSLTDKVGVLLDISKPRLIKLLRPIVLCGRVAS